MTAIPSEYALRRMRPARPLSAYLEDPIRPDELVVEGTPINEVGTTYWYVLLTREDRIVPKRVKSRFSTANVPRHESVWSFPTREEADDHRQEIIDRLTKTGHAVAA